MIARKKQFWSGAAMILAFGVVLSIVFSPVFEGKNGLEYLDSLYNSISKGSAYYIPAVREEGASFKGKVVTVTINMGDKGRATQAALLFEKSGATAQIDETRLTVSGDIGNIISNCLDDAQYMYQNDGQALEGKYGYNARQILFNWWTACKEMEKDLTRQKRFDSAKFIREVNEKAVETSYNYYQIEPQKISDRLGVVLFSLAFYVVYTLWYGFAIMYLFEGWGLQLEAH